MLTRPFHVGYLIPPESSPLHGRRASLPTRLPFGGGRVAAKASRIRRDRWYTVSRIIGSVEYCLTTPGTDLRERHIPIDWSGLKT